MSYIDAQLQRIHTIVIPIISADESFHEATRSRIIKWLQASLAGPSAKDHMDISQITKSTLPEYSEKFATLERLSWIEALESQQNKQIRGQLFASLQGDPALESLEYCRELSTCCLGVAPRLVGLPFGTYSTHMQSAGQPTVRSSPETYEAAALLRGMRKWEADFAMFLNDTAHCSFKQIARLFRLIWDMPRPAEDTPA